ncbi:GntR family transcriptional regulator [bacterium]|nr:MAG: GntR family transcriptional regulator [bacterium]
MSSPTSTKYQTVRTKLEAAIRSGEFTTGDQLPAEQTLAEQYGVSLMTARRVVCDLVAADLLERRDRKGTFVRQHAAERVSTTTLNLIVLAYDTAFQRNFLNQGMRLAEERGWRGNVIRLARGQQDAAVRAIQDGELALLMLENVQPQSALGRAVKGAKGRVVSIGLDLTNLGVRSIYVEASRSFKIVADYLRAQGHSEFVLVDQRVSPALYELHQIGWRKATTGLYTEAEADERSIHLETPNFQCPSFDAYSEVGRLLSESSLQPTALVCVGEEIVQGALAACRYAGREVPRDISIVNILDAPSMIFAHPPVTSVDVNFEQQVELALDILQRGRDGLATPATLHVVEPLLSKRESVAAPFLEAGISYPASASA